ncbi:MULTISPECIES: universal stress protein [unclassified Halobellus]|uniref:universal stress protein n=1 Tax=unclassified Halobellus TaxID=2638438 RepID=UPI000EF1ECCD|nr:MULTISPECIES: universal stress protein [unclassified Halobellus]MDQ2054502.1 universal stress protein [Halobellus sp. H-GB7]RLM89235.1 universal stress protein [Halobellus sp. Atlit-38R]
MYDDILIPTDGSTGAENAIARALDLARTSEATVHILHAVDTGAEPAGLEAAAREKLRGRVEKRGRDAAVRIQERADDLGLETVRVVETGRPHRVIRHYVDENGIDLVVMGTHGRAGAERSRLGSTTERVVTAASVPVMAVRLSGEPAPESGYTMYDHVVIPTDGSDAAERAAEHGLGIAERYGADVHVVYVVDTTTYDFDDVPQSIVGMLKQGGENAVESIAAAARDRNLPVTSNVLRGVPHEELLDYADGVDADLVTMGTRGHGEADRYLGSTTARVLRRSEMPILTSN